MKFIKNYFLLVLEAVDVTSLLEQFEASEKNPHNKSITKNNFLSGTKSNTMQQMTQENQSQILKKSSSKVCNQHTNIPDSVSKEVIDRIKVIILIKSIMMMCKQVDTNLF